MVTQQIVQPLGFNQLSTESLRVLQNNIRSLPPDQIEDLEDYWCSQDPLYWLQNYTQTENKHYIEQGLPFRGPFPHKPYFQFVFNAFRKWKRLLIPKSREMMTSWCVMGWSAQRAQWFQEETICQTESEDKAAELVDYVRQLWEYQEPFLKTRYPLITQATYELKWANGGRVISIPKGENKIRLYHPSRYVMDECAFLPEAEGCYNAAHPVCPQIIGISSAGPGWFANQCSQ